MKTKIPLFSILLFLLLLPKLSYSQYFDWVENYYGSEAFNSTKTNTIGRSVVDSEGNIYFIGNCSSDAGFHGNPFLSFTPYGPHWNTVNTVVGKMSSSGELLWCRNIHENNSCHVSGGRIQLLGDSAIACFVPRLSLARDDFKYIYYLDTLLELVHAGDYNMVYAKYIIYKNDTLYDYNRFCGASNPAAFFVLDMDGNVIENHWISSWFLDYDGNPLNPQNECEPLGAFSNTACPFAVDDDGNIYMINDMNIFLSLWIDSVSYEINISDTEYVGGLRFKIDGKRNLDMQLPENRPSNHRHNFQLLKFSPHFEKLLASQFLLEPTPEHLDTTLTCEIIDTKIDHSGNMYLIGYCSYNLFSPEKEFGEENDLYIGGSDSSMRLHFSNRDKGQAFLIKYDTALNPVYIKQFCRQETDSTNTYNNYLYSFQFDESDNMFLIGSVTYGKTTNNIYYFDSAMIDRKGYLIIKIRLDDGKLLLCNLRPPSDVINPSSRGIVANNNRLISQLRYRWYINFADSIFEMYNPAEYGMGFAVWDYDGNELLFVDYGTSGVTNQASSVCMHDSILYLTGMLASGGARFGDMTVYPTGASQSYIAKYVDTAFMHPYRGCNDCREDIHMLVHDGEPVVTVYPNPCSQRVSVRYDGGEPLVSAFLTDMAGRRHDVAVSKQDEGLYTIDFTTLPSANYLLTLVTSSGKQITSRLLKR